MYESCSNRNLFGVVRSRRTARSDTSPLCKRFARTRRCKRSPTSVRCHGELYDRTVQLEDTRKILGVSDVTKIIVFRNTEGSTTAFDKTFSTIRSRFLSTRSFSPPPSPQFSFRFAVRPPSPANALQAERRELASVLPRNDATVQLRENSKWFRIVHRCIAMHRTLQTPQPHPTRRHIATPLPTCSTAIRVNNRAP